jgi:RNA polymerase sigma factor (sigma-70 family)
MGNGSPPRFGIMNMSNQRTRARHAVRYLKELAGRSPGGPATDRELLERFVRDGSEGAFADLVARHGPMVQAVCRRHLRDAHAAEDGFQATFLVLVRKAGAVRWRESIGGWLFEVATRMARKAAGQAVRRSVREGVPAASVCEPEAPAPASDLTALQVALDEELRRLPEKFRTPLVLCHLEGLSQDEVARHLGITDGQLRGRLYRAKERLRERLVRRGFTLTGVLLALTLGEKAQALPPRLALGTLRLAMAAPHTIPVAVHLLATGVIRDMTTTFKALACLTLFGALSIIATGFALRAAPATPMTAPHVIAERAAPAPAKPQANPKTPEVSARESGYVNSVDAARNKLFVDFDLSGGKGEDADITADTKVLFSSKAARLADLKQGMRVVLVYFKGARAPNEVRAYWPRLRPEIKAVEPAKRAVVFRFEGQQGGALDVSLPVAAGAAVTLDGVPARLADVPLGQASWLTLSSDRKSLIGIAAFSRAHDIAGKVANQNLATRMLTVSPGPNKVIRLPVAVDAKVMLDGEDATFADVKRYMRVLLRRSPDRTTIISIVAVSEGYGPPLPRPAGK